MFVEVEVAGLRQGFGLTLTRHTISREYINMELSACVWLDQCTETALDYEGTC